MEKGRCYRINPTCPFCKEEHEYWDITLTIEEQHTLDSYYESIQESHSQCSDLANILDDIENKPLIITRKLRCTMCDRYFDATVTILKENEFKP